MAELLWRAQVTTSSAPEDLAASGGNSHHKLLAHRYFFPRPNQQPADVSPQGRIVVTDLINIHEVSRLMRSPENQIGFKPDLLTHGDADFLGQVVAHALKVRIEPAVVDAELD